MLHYLTQWAHLYVIHFGFWVTFGMGADVYKNGLPPVKKLPNMLKVAVIIASIMSIFSSHSHHFLTNVVPETKGITAQK